MERHGITSNMRHEMEKKRKALKDKAEKMESAKKAQGGAGGNKSFHLSGWNYTIPLTASWEIDVFAKTLNSKRGAEASSFSTLLWMIR